MADLTRTPPFDGASLPLALGESRLEALTAGIILAIAPYPGHEDDAARALGAFPTPGDCLTLGGGRLVWAGRAVAFLFDPDDPSEEVVARRLAGLAAVTEQSDGWVGLRLSGADAPEVLARLVPLDLAGMPDGTSARSVLNHAPLLLVRRDGAFEMWSFRSMAGTILHEVEGAMRAVAARRGSRPGT
ncbi:sarcosine oxidase subunit gamma [Palleronia sp. KMU-117]|uniref:sarcosine oxidase subunit gamma n=1 Tax=Palleronia sp. KMU-117 TaxID=3434108 RepID=UPI003D73F528